MPISPRFQPLIALTMPQPVLLPIFFRRGGTYKKTKNKKKKEIQIIGKIRKNKKIYISGKNMKNTHQIVKDWLRRIKIYKVKEFTI
jgi:hypothetical protein